MDVMTIGEGIADCPFLIFYGEVSEDSAAPDALVCDLSVPLR